MKLMTIASTIAILLSVNTVNAGVALGFSHGQAHDRHFSTTDILINHEMPANDLEVNFHKNPSPNGAVLAGYVDGYGYTIESSGGCHYSSYSSYVSGPC